MNNFTLSSGKQKEPFVAHPEIWTNHNWAKVVKSINAKYQFEVLKYGGDNRAYIHLDIAICYDITVSLWIDWLEKSCRCGAAWKLLCTITGTSDNDGRFGDNYEFAKAYFGPGYPTCDHYKDQLSFDRAVSKGGDEVAIETERIIGQIKENPTDWKAVFEELENDPRKFDTLSNDGYIPF